MEITGSKVVLNLSGADNMKHVEPDDFVIHLRSFQGGIEHSSHRGKVSNAYTVFAPTEAIEPRYYRWVLKAPAFIQELRTTTEQLRDGQSIKFEQFADIVLPRPPVGMQQRIADFLDDQVTRIDNIIAARASQGSALAALSDRANALAWEALASQYGIARAGYLLRGMEQGWSPQAEGREANLNEWAVMRSGCVNGGRFDAADHKALPPGLLPRREYEIRGGDLLMSRASGSRDLIGSVAVVDRGVRPRLMLPDKVYRLLPEPSKATVEYLAMMLRSTAARNTILEGISGAEGMANNLPAPVVKSIPIPAVPIGRQSEIAARYESARRDLLYRVNALNHSRHLLAELKRSLITAAVTGEFDVSSADGSRVPV